MLQATKRCVESIRNRSRTRKPNVRRMRATARAKYNRSMTMRNNVLAKKRQKPDRWITLDCNKKWVEWCQDKTPNAKITKRNPIFLPIGKIIRKTFLHNNANRDNLKSKVYLPSKFARTSRIVTKLS